VKALLVARFSDLVLVVALLAPALVAIVIDHRVRRRR
jgi:hypothetical protein